MIKFHRHNDVDKEKWNRCITRSLSPTFFADYDFLSVANPEWAALIEDDYVAVMPLPWRKKRGLKYIYNPFFYSRLGIFASEAITDAKTAQFVAAIPRSFISAEVNLNEVTPVATLEGKWNCQVSHRLSLNDTYDAISRHFSSNHRRNIKAARSCSQQLCADLAISDIITLFRNNRGKDRHIRIKEADYANFERMCEFAAARGLLEVWGSRSADGTLLAGMVFLRDGNRLWFWFSGRDERYADRKAMFFLMDEYIRQHAETQYILDFNGSKNENVARFYSGFGGEKYTFPALSVILNPLLKPALKIYRKIK